MAGTEARPLSVLTATLRLLTFCLSREDFGRLGKKHLAFGFFCTWLVGIGRFWDHPNAKLFQYLGLGSVIYVIVFSAFLWLFVKPLRPARLPFLNLLTFVTLVSPPALLYAIPVERWYPIETASNINKWFLLIVAAWRVALLFFYLIRYAGLGGEVFIAILWPLSLIIVILTTLKVENAAFRLMAGLDRAPTAEDGAEDVLLLLTAISQLLFIPLGLIYMGIIASKRFPSVHPPPEKEKKQAPEETEEQ